MSVGVCGNIRAQRQHEGHKGHTMTRMVSAVVMCLGVYRLRIVNAQV